MSESKRYERGVSRQIENAQRSGKFDNLSGKGKPLNLKKNPNLNSDLEASYKLLEDNDYLLPWMEKGQQIDRQFQIARDALEATWRLVASSNSGDWVNCEWQRAKTAFRNRIAEVNKLIRDHNLEIPHLSLERFVLDAEREIDKIKAGSGQA